MPKGDHLALCAAVNIDAGTGGEIEWLHLLPQGTIRTEDGRGPYHVTDYAALMAASMKDGAKLVLDENHSTDLAAPKGLPAPAQGWIVELQQRANGIWGRVDWTADGRSKVEGKQYRGISPVIAHRKDGTITAILRASLVNRPNFTGLTALHQEDGNMDLRGKLVEALGLGEDADDDAIVAAVNKALGGASEAVHAALSPIATALGLAADAAGDDVLVSINALQEAKPGEADLVALQAQLTDTASALNALQAERATERATDFVDAAIADGRAGVKPLRDRYIAMHMKDAAETEELVNALPKLAGTVITRHAPKSKASAELDDADRAVISLMGLDPKEFKKARQAELGVEEEAL